MLIRLVGLALIGLCVLGFLLDAVGRYPSATIAAAIALLVVPVALGLLAFGFRRLTRRDPPPTEPSARRAARLRR